MPARQPLPARSFRASSIAEAVAEVKRALGPNAVIVSTRTMGEVGARVAEVLAAPPDAVRRGAEGRPDGATPVVVRPESETAQRTVRDEIADVRRLMAQLIACGRSGAGSRAVAGAGPLPEPLFAAMSRLRDAGLPEPAVEEIVDSLRRSPGAPPASDARAWRQRVLDSLAARAGVSAVAWPDGPGRGRPLTIAFFGPTGAGKTTTAAKVAASCVRERSLRVGVVAFDPYRPGAGAPLRACADAIGAEYVPAPEGSCVRAACGALRARADVILVDSGGCAPTDRARIEEVAAAIDGASPDVRCLVLSASMCEHSAARAHAAFACAAPDRLAITRLDEAAFPAPLLTFPRRFALPLALLADGADVPGHVHDADAMRIAHAILDLEMPAVPAHG